MTSPSLPSPKRSHWDSFLEKLDALSPKRPSVGFKQLETDRGLRWFRIVNGEPERELTDDEARDVSYGIWP